MDICLVKERKCRIFWSKQFNLKGNSSHRNLFCRINDNDYHCWTMEIPLIISKCNNIYEVAMQF